MTNEVLRTLLILSATGAVLTIAVYALSPLARRFLPARWLKNAATLVLLAYALPVWLALPPLSALLPEKAVPQAQNMPPTVTEALQTVQAEPLQEDTAAPEAVQQPIPVVYKEAAAQQRPFPSGLVLAVWGAGAAVMLSRTLVSYAVFRRRLKKQSEPVAVCALLEACRAEAGVRRRVRLYRTALVRAPALAGLMRPAILLPWGDFSADDLRAALLHELHHLKSRDLARKWLAALVQCVHWWNPFAYLAARLLHRSCETACDLAVTGKMDSAGRAAYMKAVLSFAAAGMKAPPLTTSMSAGGREIERRFIMIARQKPVKLLARLTALALTAGLLVSGLGVGAVAVDASAGKLESNQQEILYPHSELHFSVELEPNKTYPDWLNDIVGTDKTVHIDVTLASIRHKGGRFDALSDYITIIGSRGSCTLRSSALCYGTITEDPHTPLNFVIRFNRTAPSRYTEGSAGDQNELVQLHLHYADPNTQPVVHICFSVESDRALSMTINSGDMNSIYPILAAENISSASGVLLPQNFLDPVTREQYLHSPYIFGIHESNYQNQHVDGISIQLESASTTGIYFSTNITRSEPCYYILNAFDSAWDKTTLSLDSIDIPNPVDITQAVPLSNSIAVVPAYGREFVSGETYRVELALLDASGSIIYRQLEYVTIP